MNRSRPLYFVFERLASGTSSESSIDAWRERANEFGGFHRQIVYPDWKPA